MEAKVLTDMKLSNKEYAALNAQAANYRTILRLVKIGGLDQYLKDKQLPPIDLLQTPDDMMAGDSINLFLKDIADNCNKMDQKIISLSQALVDANIALAKEKRQQPIKIEGNLWQRIKQGIRNFLFVRG